ncbi:MAG TPA: ATP-binding protein [Polyangiaceae bacterium]|nr:ATP-binding protein [Polyangiaceae bacterium]
MSESAHELGRLLASEITRRLRLFDDPYPPAVEVRAALHSLKGSAGMAGHTELSLVIAQCAQRVHAEQPGALGDTRAMLAQVLARLNQDLPPFPSVWPEPPPFLGPSRIDSKYHAQYYAAIRERLGELDSVLASTDDALLGLERAQRAVHAMKGAAAALGDDVTAWYCHGLEAALRSVPRDGASAIDALVDLARHRALFTLLLDDQARGLETLRVLAAPTRRVLPPKPAALPPSRPRNRVPSRPPSRPPSGEFQLNSEVSLKVPVSTLDAFGERLERIDLVHDELLRTGDLARHLSTRLRDTSAGLSDVRRALTGSPADPHVLAQIELASAQLLTSAANAERGAGVFRRNAEFLRARTGEMRSELGALRRASLHSLFETVRRATLRDADHEGKSVAVEIVGPDVPIDRRVSERLFDTVLQLAKNSLVHGLEGAEERARAGKATVGRVTLSAEQIGEWLRITVADDGRGADVARIRELAVAAGAVTRAAADRAAEDDLLALLFLPGLTTHQRADLLAGRGLGLDLVQDTIRRLGGTIRLRSRVGGGLTASFEMPSDQTVVEVLWLEELGQKFALPVSFTGRVEASDPSHAPPVRLARCLGQKCPESAAVSLELTVYGVTPIRIGLDGVGEIEQVALRALPDLIAERGPYGGAVLRSDGTLHLALDAPLVAARAWTLRPPQPQDAA